MDASIQWAVGSAFALLLIYGLCTNPEIKRDFDEDDEEFEEPPKSRKTTLKPKSTTSLTKRNGEWVEEENRINIF